jgi:carbon storage regulator
LAYKLQKPFANENRKEGKMLILTRRTGESIMIGNDVKITVTRVAVDKVRIGIKAPQDVAVYREELYETMRGKQTVTVKHRTVAAEKTWPPAGPRQGGIDVRRASMTTR